MKKYLFVSFALGIGSLVYAQPSKDPYMIKQLDADNIQQGKVETTGGNISGAGVANAARVEVYVWPGNSRDRAISKEELKKRLEEDYDLTVTAENHTLTAISK